MRSLNQLYLAVVGMITSIFLAALGFHLIDGIRFFDALWMTMITVLTIGYGDMVPQSENARLFGLFIIPISVGLVSYALASVAAVIIEGAFSEKARRRKMEKAIQALEGM